jgi:hypothetical protein
MKRKNEFADNVNRPTRKNNENKTTTTTTTATTANISDHLVSLTLLSILCENHKLIAAQYVSRLVFPTTLERTGVRRRYHHGRLRHFLYLPTNTGLQMM